MGKVTIGFDDYEGQQYDEYQGEDPRPGWYTFELQKVGYTDETEEALRWIFVIADGPYAGWAGFVFGNFETTKWKNQETVRAIQGGSEKPLTVDFGNEKQVAALIKRAKRVRGKVETYTNRETGEARLSLRKVRPLLEDASTKPPASDVEDLDDQIEDGVTEAGEDEVEDYTREELEDMDLKDLKEILKEEFEYNARQLRGIKDEDAAIDAILEEQGGEPEGEGDEDDADADGDFDDDFDNGDAEPEPEPEPEPAPRRRRAAAATKAAPAKAAPAKAAAPAQRTRRARR